MRDELSEGLEPEKKRGLSRRNALKAGVAVGVGAVAWSGASITSLGGTPAYAATVSGITTFSLNDKCRNTDQASNCPGTSLFRYHTLNGTLPAGFTLLNNPGEGTCCGTATPPSLAWDETITGPLDCEIIIAAYNGNNQCKALSEPDLLARGCNDVQTTCGALPCVSTVMPCHDAGTDSGTFYTIYAVCATPGHLPPCPPPL